MCTVSIIPTRAIDRAIRVVFNRDELKSRPPARPPEVRDFGDCRAIFPVDAVSDGTWIAANDAGLAFALLNINSPGAPAHQPDREMLSRGKIIHGLVASDSIDEATERALSLPVCDFRPFRLLIFDGRGLSEIISDGNCARAVRGPLEAAVMRCSSGLGDALVEAPRRQLFESMLGASPTPQAQDQFHRHYWPAKRHISVCMERADARTVSRTTLEMSKSGGALMRYESLGES